MSSLAGKLSPKSNPKASLRWIRSNCHHSPRCEFLIRIAVFKLPYIVSTVGVDLILAGIYVEEKSLFMEKIVPVAIHINSKRRKATLSIFVQYNFLKAIVFISLSKNLHKCVEYKRERSHGTCPLVWKGTERSQRGCKGAIIDSWLFSSLFISVFVGITIGNSQSSYI